MNSREKVFEHTLGPEWNYSYFRLQLILSHPNIQIISVSKNPTASTYLAEKQYFFKIDAAINITQDTPETIDKLKNNLLKGTIFKCGRISQQPVFVDGFGNQKTYRMMLFKIAVKDLLPIYKTNLVTKQDLLNFTQQYDSIYLSHRKQQISAYQHDYLLKSTSQYIWEYDILYRYINANQPGSKVRKWIPQNYLCQQCNQQKAVWFCSDEKVLFCRECYEDAHKGRNRMAHKKQSINALNCFKKCEKMAHQNKIMSYYCFLCKQIKCQKCLNDSVHIGASLKQLQLQQRLQTHSQPKSRAHHQFIEVKSLMEMFKNRERELNLELKFKLTTKIKQIQLVISQLSSNYQNKLKQLEQTFKIQIHRLKRQSRKQINQAVSIHTELKRKFDEVLWMQNFLLHTEKVLDIGSNIELKQLSTAYIENMKVQEYFERVNKKIKLFF